MKCYICGGKGWTIMNITFQFAELQRCDICKKYKGDIEAAQAFFKENKGKMVWSLDKITIKL